MNRFILFCGAWLLLFAACSPKTTAVTKANPNPKTPDAPLTAQSVLARCVTQTPKADWLAGDVGLDYVGKPMSVGASSTLHFRRDSVLWIAVRKLGFNVARAKITRDSVILVNYFQKNYVAQSLQYLEQQYGLPADFSKIQQLLLGEPIIVTAPEALTLSRNASGDWQLNGKNEQWTTEYTLDSATFALKTMRLQQPKTQRDLQATFERYESIGGTQRFAIQRFITLTTPQTGTSKLTLEVELPLEINIPKGTKLAIPEDYERQ